MTDSRRRRMIRIGLVAAVVAGAVGVSVYAPVGEYLQGFVGWVQGWGVWGAVAFGAAYAVAAVLAVPGSLITLAAGFTFGVIWGTVVVSAASTVGAALSFVVGRCLIRDWVAAKVADHPRFQALYRAIDREAFKTVLLVRLVPLFPFGLVNYGFSATDVTFGRYVLGSWLGMLPATVMYVYIGSAAGSLARIASGQVERSGLQNAFFVVGGAAAVVVTVVLTRRARRELDTITDADDQDQSSCQ